MRRGYVLEDNLNKVAEYLESQGIHMHKNHAQRTQQGIYVKGEPFDYEVFSHGKVHCFDAKECQTGRWNLSNAKPQQVNALKMCKNNGTESYFLVWFVKTNEFIRFDVDVVISALSSGKSSLTPKEGVKWQWTELAT